MLRQQFKHLRLQLSKPFHRTRIRRQRINELLHQDFTHSIERLFMAHILDVAV